MRTKNEVTGLGSLTSSSAVLDMLSVWEMSGGFPIYATRMEVVSDLPLLYRSYTKHTHFDVKYNKRWTTPYLLYQYVLENPSKGRQNK